MDAKEADKEATCVLCGEPVEGEVDHVRLTLCCADCCMETVSEDEFGEKKHLRTSMAGAMSDYGCAHADLGQLAYHSVRNPHHKSWSPMKLYLKAEAKYLGDRRQEKRDAQKQHRQLKITKKKQTLEKRLGTSLKRMDRVIRYFLLGDYLSKPTGTSMKARDVKARYAALDRVTEILKAHPKAHPGAVFDFCMDYADCGPTEFAELREKIRLVFRLEGHRIFRLSEVRSKGIDEAKMFLKKTPLGDDFVESLETSRTLVRTHLARMSDAETASKIMNHASLVNAELLRDFPEDRIARKVFKTWTRTQRKRQRYQELQKALKSAGFSYARSDIEECYLDGQIDVEEAVSRVQQIVGHKREREWWS